ncbi:MAG: tRNA 2-thiouridine(34) synthase MnmA [Candidatus Marinimicrobia bacterium]|jgi:tRNA-specific 2-thiouridylase|nr:tRNA 2-thiouridine(34) synthase MnmA [Candidatus Neomarinimicrobiota bacterium]|tara:strand:+ start:2076 stop:3152 length:1077 start_codon:yes stop_codon:yes gene_type:complete
MPKRVIVGMSGGVDSSVAALLLKDQGVEVECIFMKNWDDDSEFCQAEQDYRDALQVCNTLDLPLHTINFTEEYRSLVFSHFLEEEKSGRTPNPDILCNQEIKFKLFLDYALSLNADFIATGHYAKIERSNGQYSLHKGTDKGKDQSYFLYPLNQYALSHSLFPLGDLKKSQVRKLATDAGLVTSDKKDSTGICFIGKRNFPQFLRQFIPENPGNIVTNTGKIVGQHEGLMFFTIGQRKGIGIGGGHGKKELPWYVVEKDIKTNDLVVVQGHDHPLLHSQKLRAGQLHWIGEISPNEDNFVSAKIRYRQKDQPCTLSYEENASCIVTFDKKQFAVTPGQSIVFFCNEQCLGGGIIEEKL